MIPDVLLSVPVLASVAYLVLVAVLTFWIHRRITAAEERSVLLGKRVSGIRKNLGKIRDSYGDGTVTIPELVEIVELIDQQATEARGELQELANRVRILPAQMARAARGERYDSDEDDDEDEGSGPAADEATPEQVAALIAARANGNPAPAGSEPKSIERQVFEMLHSRR